MALRTLTHGHPCTARRIAPFGAACPTLVAKRHVRPGWCMRQLPVAQSSAGTSNGVLATATPAAHGGSVAEIKQQVLAELANVDRGIFGVPAAKKASLLALIGELEKQTPHAAPTKDLELVKGDWRLLYSTITITGVKRTKLGLREFVRLGDFIQTIDTASNTAINTIAFSVTGLSSLKGALTIRAKYSVANDSRVAITYVDSSLTPAQLQIIFEQHLGLLLSIFNPDGHLDITYLDDTWRAGRDDKGNVFLLERA